MSSTSAFSFRLAGTVILLSLFASASLSPAAAQATTSKMKGMQLSNNEPIQIESDKLEIKDPESKAMFTGNVKVVQGTTTLQAGKMVVFYKKGGGSISGGNAEIDRIEVDQKVFLQSGTQQATADTGEIETFLLGVRGAEGPDIDVYSLQSPLGSAITGAHAGEQRTYSVPSGASVPVTLLKAVPYGIHAPNSKSGAA